MSTIVYADRAASARHARAEQALGRAAAAARKAPVLGAEHPWRWQLAGDRAELWLAAGGREPSGRDAARHVVDCGAALHHARTVLAGEGALHQVVRFPDPARWPLLATVLVTGFAQATPADVRAYRAVSLRPGAAAWRGPAAVAAAHARLAAAAAAQGCGLELLAPPAGEPGDEYAARIVALDDGPRGRLCAGEALSAVALAAVQERLTVTPAGGPATDALGRLRVPVRLAAPGGRAARQPG